MSTDVLQLSCKINFTILCCFSSSLMPNFQLKYVFLVIFDKVMYVFDSQNLLG